MGWHFEVETTPAAAIAAAVKLAATVGSPVSVVVSGHANEAGTEPNETLAPHSVSVAVSVPRHNANQ